MGEQRPGRNKHPLYWYGSAQRCHVRHNRKKETNTINYSWS